LQLLTVDGEPGAEIYRAATKKEQARIVFGDAQNMARKSTTLLKKIKVQQHSIFAPATLSKMVPMSSDSNTEDGLNPHGIIIDEYHAHPNDELYSVLNSATGARSQPLLSIITTAGFNRLGPCAQLRKACVVLLDGTHPVLGCRPPELATRAAAAGGMGSELGACNAGSYPHNSPDFGLDLHILG
jgi:phage terminase large subunit-like protein